MKRKTINNHPIFIFAFVFTSLIVITFMFFCLGQFKHKKNHYEETKEHDRFKVLNNTTTRSVCIEGHWYVERLHQINEINMFYGIVPLFDTDGLPLKCPTENNSNELIKTKGGKE